MSIHRRSFLKALAVAPVTLFQPFRSMEALSTPGDNIVNIFLLGLFLMEFQGEDLILVTPQFKHHQFCILQPDGTVGPMPEYINLWDRLTPGSVATFQPENLKFPATAIKPSGYLLDPQNPSKHKHRCTMVLPKPSNIIVGKLEPCTNFHSKSSKVGDYIKNGATNGKLGSITCLQYEARDKKPYYYGYFALHHPLSLGTVNAALRSARHVCGQGFDLQMHDLPPTASMIVPKCPDLAELKTLVKSDTSVENLATSVASVPVHADVASCPQFGITG